MLGRVVAMALGASTNVQALAALVSDRIDLSAATCWQVVAEAQALAMIRRDHPLHSLWQILSACVPVLATALSGALALALVLDLEI